MIYKNIGKKIQKAREEAGLSQEELASRLGYTQAALSNYELGKRRLYLANIEQIAAELNKPLSYFLADSPLTDDHKKEKAPMDETLLEIVSLLTELPANEKKDILEYIRWRRDRLK
jgi:transcriptional regulator with XRE-family HTH domain